MSDDLAALRQAIDKFPETVTAQLRAVAWRYSRAAMARSKQILQSKTVGHGKDHVHTADAIVVLEQPEKKQFLVTVENPENPMLGNWLEYGTRKMEARPYMRPAEDELTPGYVREMTATATDTAERTFGNL